MKLKINFILKTGVHGEIPVLAIMNFGYKEFDALKQTYVYKPLRYYTGIKVKKSDWNEIEKLPTDKSKRATLLQIEKQATDIFNYLITTETVTPERLKQELDVKIKKKEDQAIVTRVRLVDFIENEILQEHGIKQGTKNCYKVLSNRLTDFETKIGKQLYSSDLNEELYVSFMNTIRERCTRINAVTHYYKAFKAVLNRIARKYKVNVFNPTRELRSTDKLRSVTEEKIYLEFAQIEKIIAYEPETKDLANAKLILLTLLFTGCRYSDVHKIKPEYTYSKNNVTFHYARYLTTKTDTEIVVPILKPLQEAFDANGGTAEPMAMQKFNSLARDIAESVGLKEEITLSHTNSFGKKELTTKKLFQLISSHIGRRSFVTNLMSYIPITVLSKITGHTNSAIESDFKGLGSSEIFKYNKISLIDNAALLVKILRIYTEDKLDDFPIKLV
ncbi:tyrosine-type recombinase/integrase [Fluviicola chungangensis]|uniref:Tyrosine-type recombinase/integrase n=1 Tax=Fluviicola chungangensis TaxID=2597671 RepID=A0A556MIN2_9FLAO|nr:tyrosine-type recombinase/integrase [Fluviicola chungangensis]TSJ39777.1 tyrosine-type recombinase/integrase [Fluviicola chungangensis]